MNTCGTCKYRGEPLEMRNPDEDSGDYMIPSSYFACDLIKHDEGYRYKPKAGAVVVDGSGYTATLCVEEDFGCNRWFPKEIEDVQPPGRD